MENGFWGPTIKNRGCRQTGRQHLHCNRVAVPAALVSTLAAFLVRGGALHYGWQFPVFRAREGRTPDEVRKERKLR